MATLAAGVGVALQRIPPFPAIAQRLMALTAKDNVSFREIGDVLQADPGYSMEVLRLANSAGFATRQEVRSILVAVSLLGVERLEALVITVALSRFAKAVAKTDLFRASWRHSLACALIAEDLAPSFHLLKAECYSLALLHDIGRFALLVAMPQEYQALIAGLGNGPASVAAAEREAFGVDHCELGHTLLRKWGLPLSFEQPICCHHEEPSKAGHSQQHLVYAACAGATRFGFAVGPGEPVEWEEGVLRKIPREASDLLATEELPDSVAERINRIECSNVS